MKGFKFKVSGIPWEVCPLPMIKILELADHLDAKTPDFSGLTCYQTQKVYIVTDHESSIEFKRSVLFHELVHVFLSPANSALEEELVCNLVGNSLVELFAQWHKFPLWVTGAIKHGVVTTK